MKKLIKIIEFFKGGGGAKNFWSSPNFAFGGQNGIFDKKCCSFSCSAYELCTGLILSQSYHIYNVWWGQLVEGELKTGLLVCIGFICSLSYELYTCVEGGKYYIRAFLVFHVRLR